MKEKINIYKCSKGHETVTIDRDEGTTPMIMMCRHVGEHHACTEHAHSSWYMVDQSRQATHEWYKELNIKKVSPMDREHVRMGGLLLRKIQKQKV